MVRRRASCGDAASLVGKPMADRPLPRWALLAAGALVVPVVVIVTLRTMVRSYLESEEFRSALEQLATDVLRGVDTELRLRVSTLHAESFLAVRLDDLKLTRRDKPVMGLSVRADLDLFPSALAGQAHFVVSASLARGGQIKASGALALGQALGLLLDGELPRGVAAEVSAKEIDASDVVAIWPSLAKNSRLNLVAGRLAGSLVLAERQKASPVSLAVGQTHWRVPALGDKPMILPPWSAKLEASADALATAQPLRLQLPVAAMTVQGKMSFAGTGGDGTELDLTVAASGGMMGRVAVAKLLGCQQTPQKDNFAVKGPAKRPLCR
jgi:hypothetical protein